MFTTDLLTDLEQDHEQALIDAIAKLTDISDGESGNYAHLVFFFKA